MRLVLMDVVFLHPRNLLRIFASLYLLSSFSILRIFFLIILLACVLFVFVCLHLTLCSVLV